MPLCPSELARRTLLARHPSWLWWCFGMDFRPPPLKSRLARRDGMRRDKARQDDEEATLAVAFFSELSEQLRRFAARRPAYSLRGRGQARNVTLEFGVVARERVVTAAGEFDAFRAEGFGTAGAWSIEERIWCVPWLEVPVHRDRHNVRYLGGQPSFRWAERREIVSACPFAIDRRGRCLAGRSRPAAHSP